MEQIFGIITGVLKEAWEILNESSPYLLLGFVIAGLLKAFIPDSLVEKHLGGKGPGPVIKAALFGVPIPLCSCGVIPAAIGLRKQGASKGATTSFLISTPETGVDSIAITYALLGPVYAIFRPVAAFFSAVVAGLLENLFDKEEIKEPVATETIPKACCSSCGCSAQIPDTDLKAPRVIDRVRESIKFAFGDLLADIGMWLLIGILLAGIITYAVPDDFFAGFLSNNFVSYLIMLAVGIPLYICATASTPLAAALILKGVSPGAALVFLLAGPATNMATITVVGKTMGRKSLIIYLSSIAVTSLVAGYILDLICGNEGINITGKIAASLESGGSFWMNNLASILVLALIARSIWIEKLSKNQW
ncbi:MAG: SO_0444 family Cu/Zn efflux transporter [bacterium]|nr:SO_0444 family Cu/Zn efflux transporter [bacterium]